MKKISFFCLFVLCFAACDEIPPSIELIPPERKVLVEEFTGILCVNCPEGAERLETLLDIHGENLVVVSIHSGFFAMPHSSSRLDFRTPEAEAIDALIGPVTAYPSASINRQRFPDESSRIVNATTWAGYILQELARSSPVQMAIRTDFDPENRTLTGTVDLIYFENLDDPSRLTIYLVEDGIIDSQFGEDGLELDYVHRHVMRKTITPFNGQVLNNTLVSNEIQQVSFSTSVDSSWVFENMSVVALVSKASPDFEVHQVEQVKLGE